MRLRRGATEDAHYLVSQSSPTRQRMLGVSRDYLDEHIKPELRIIRRGPKTSLIPVTELVRWVEQSAARWS